MINNARMLGLDVGERRIGIAISDDLGITAQARDCLHRSAPDKDLATLKALAEKEQAVAFVVGLPRRTSGAEGPEAEKVRAFAAELAQATSLPIYFVDERFSTAIAESVLLAADMRRKQRRQKIDQVAAAIILQGYLDKQRSLQRLADPNQ